MTNDQKNEFLTKTMSELGKVFSSVMVICSDENPLEDLQKGNKITRSYARWCGNYFATIGLLQFWLDAEFDDNVFVESKSENDKEHE